MVAGAIPEELAVALTYRFLAPERRDLGKHHARPRRARVPHAAACRTSPDVATRDGASLQLPYRSR